MKKLKTILQIADLTLDGNNQLNDLFNIVPLSKLKNHQDDIEGSVATGDNKVDKHLIDKLPNLKIIGSLIDEDTLIKAINQNIIAGAALDVFSDELFVTNELIESNKVVLLHHIASRTTETFRAMEDLLIRNLQNYFCVCKLITPVQKG